MANALLRPSISEGRALLQVGLGARRANSICERLIGTLRRDCVDHVVVLDDLRAARILREHVRPPYKLGTHRDPAARDVERFWKDQGEHFCARHTRGMRQVRLEDNPVMWTW